jgi:uncharacterized surface anchored protein
VFSALPLALILSAGLVMPTSALAASEGLSGYSTTPTTTTTTTPPPTTTTSSGVAANTETTPTGTSKSSTLPFTGFDLRWALVIGFALVAAGTSLLLMQRRQRRGIGR